VPTDMLLVGELTLAGEVRPVSQAARRINEGRRFGFSRFVAASGCELPDEKGVVRVATVKDALKVVFG